MSFNAFLLSDLKALRVRIDIKRLIDQNKILKIQINSQGNINEIFFVFQLISHNQIYSSKKYSKTYQKTQLNEIILFDWGYQNLSCDSRIGITIWSSIKKYQQKKPLGSTVIPIFDENDCLRQGKYHLFIWPDVLPDLDEPTSTPGLTDDPNVQTLNFITEKKQSMSSKNNYDQKIDQALTLKLIYTYKLIPAAFLQVEFPKFPYKVLYQDKLCYQIQDSATMLPSLNQIDFNDCFQVNDPDFEAERTDPLQQTYYFLRRQNQINPQKIVPNKEDLKVIDSVVHKNLKADNLKPNQKQLFVKYRYFLSLDKRYLIYYLHSIQWGSHEENQAVKLIQVWAKIDWQDALHLLSKQFAANSLYNKKKSQSHNIMKLIRDYATQIISKVSDEIFKSILLQLIQTVRYDVPGDSSMIRLIVEKSLQIQQIAISSYWYLKTQSEVVKDPKSNKVEQINQDVRIYMMFFKNFQEQIQNRNSFIWKIIIQQEKLITFLRDLSKVIKGMKGDRSQREAQYRKRLNEVDWQAFGPVPFPLNLSLVIKHPIITDCSIFSSAMAPFRLTFQLTNGEKYGFIYKNGDDLRQDQLILGMFALMDKILKGVNQDYKLTPYQALACSKSDGFVQFVPKTKTFQSISLKDYLIQLMKKKSEGLIMQNYIFSTAGYCAITYFFMIGDRHLENLLIDEQGKIFHIDFGFILGRDPKPYPPPIKISKEMIDAMSLAERQEQQNFKKFKLKCLEAYLYLRKQAKMVYNLTALMLDSGIKDVHIQGLNKLFEKFSINLNDEEAQKYFLLVLEQCKNALFPSIADKIHIWATYFRK